MQRRDLVIKVVAAFVEAAGVERQRIFDEICIDHGHAGGARCSVGLFEQVEETPRVAVGIADQSIDRDVFELQVRQRLLLRSLEQLAQFIFGQRL